MRRHTTRRPDLTPSSIAPTSPNQIIFDEIVPLAHVLMTDVFGNYVLQKLFEYGNPDQCESLAVLLR